MLRVIAILLLAATPAFAEADKADDQVVVVNAASKIGDVGQISKLTRALNTYGMLFKLPDQLAATLDGRASLIADIDAIKDSFANRDFEAALKMIEADEQRIMQGTVSDPIPALAELAQWRGLIYAGLENNEEAVRQFRAAWRLNPGWMPDKKSATPRVRNLAQKARREPKETGILVVDADPVDALISIDGAEATREDRQKLPIGIHLVTITAPDRKPYNEIVDITPKDTFRITITLDSPTTLDKAARLVDQSAAAPPGKARLKRAKSLSKLTGVKRLLFVEDGDDGHLLLRLYDVELKKVSDQVEVPGSANGATIARKIRAALDPDNLIDVSAVVVTRETTVIREHTPWYARWYVWAGVAAIAGGSYLGYEYMTREPTMLRF